MNHRNSLVQFSCTVVVPYEWVWIVESYLLSSNLRPSHDMLDEGVQVPFFLPLLFSIPVDPSRCGLSLFACSVFVALFYSLSLILIVTMSCGSKEGESCASLRLVVLPC
jgi:hypothetical protein